VLIARRCRRLDQRQGAWVTPMGDSDKQRQVRAETPASTASGASDTWQGSQPKSAGAYKLITSELRHVPYYLVSYLLSFDRYLRYLP
jgi:hypothetical protein